MTDINNIQRLKDFLTFFEVHANSYNSNGLCYYYASFVKHNRGSQQTLLNYIGNSDLKMFESDYPNAYAFAETVAVGTLHKSCYWFSSKAERVEFLKQFIKNLEKAKND